MKPASTATSFKLLTLKLSTVEYLASEVTTAEQLTLDEAFDEKLALEASVVLVLLLSSWPSFSRVADIICLYVRVAVFGGSY